MKNLVAQPRLFGCLSLLFLTAAFLTAFYDLSVSTRFVNTESTWALFLQTYGKVPGLLTAFAGATMLAANIPRERGILGPLVAVLAILVVAIVTLFTVQVFAQGHVDVNSVSRAQAVTWPLGGIAVFGTLAALLSRFPSVRNARVQRFGRVTVFTLIAGNLVAIQGLKQLWGRARFRDLSSDLSDFTAWYLPQGHTGDASFPSGHVGMAWLLLPLLLLIPPGNRAARIVVGTSIVVWSVLVAASRVKVGAHYASDVLFASAIEIAVFAGAAILTRPKPNAVESQPI